MNGMDWIHLVHNMDEERVLVSVVTNLLIPLTAGNLTSCAYVSLSRRALLHRISYFTTPPKTYNVFAQQLSEKFVIKRRVVFTISLYFSAVIYHFFSVWKIHFLKQFCGGNHW